MNYLLFTTTRCPKCPEFKAYVSENIDFPGQVLDENNPEFSEKSLDFGITVAPTIVILKEGKEVFRGSEVSELEGFLKGV